MKTTVFCGIFAAMVLFVAGCSEPSVDVDAASSDLAAAPDVTPGTFRLFAEADHVSNPECETFTKLELMAGGRARLASGIEGHCSLTAVIDANERDYDLELVDTACGAKVYKGIQRGVVGGPPTITITDNRAMTCFAPAQAKIVVEELLATATGTPTTLNSDDVLETLAIACSGPRGSAVRFYRSKGDRDLSRAVYVEASNVVSDMNVCVAYPNEGGPDEVRRTYACNDVSWVDGFSVDLYEGGLSGRPTVKLHKTGSGGEPQLVRELDCFYVAHR